MLNNEAFILRLEEILGHYHLTATAFADRLGVQRSGISHILSGRNKPSLDFVMRLVHAFPEVSLSWLLEGTGSFPARQEERADRQESTKPRRDEKEVASILVIYRDGSFESFDRSRRN